MSLVGVAPTRPFGQGTGIPLITEKETRELLSAHESTLFSCINNAWQKWLVIKLEESVWNPRTRANIVHNSFENAARTAFGVCPEVAIVEEIGRFLLLVKDSQNQSRLMVQFKKLNEQFRPSNYPTQTALDFAAQLEFPELPKVPRVTIGYQLNRAQTEIREIRVIFLQGTSVQWYYEISAPPAPPVKLEAAPPTAEQTKKPSRIRKRQTEQVTNEETPKTSEKSK